jgi:hypothetical protein
LNHVPVTNEPSANVQIDKSAAIITEIAHLERYYEAKVQAGSSSSHIVEPAVHFETKSAARAAFIDSNSVHSAVHLAEGWAHRWVPPTSVNEDNDNYHAVLREDRSL